MHLVRLPYVPLIGRLIAGPPLWIESEFKSVSVGFVVGKETVVEISPREPDFSPVIIFPPVLCTHIWLVYDRRCIIFATDSVVQQNSSSSLMILVKWPTWRTILFYVFIFCFNSLRVSSTSCSSSGETNCVNTSSGNSHSENRWVIHAQWGWLSLKL